MPTPDYPPEEDRQKKTARSENTTSPEGVAWCVGIGLAVTFLGAVALYNNPPEAVVEQVNCKLGKFMDEVSQSFGHRQADGYTQQRVEPQRNCG
ncbi:MAG: hypothetical protein AB7E85_07640 [Pseudobdellovibrionaceae bacterium]